MHNMLPTLLFSVLFNSSYIYNCTTNSTLVCDYFKSHYYLSIYVILLYNETTDICVYKIKEIIIYKYKFKLLNIYLLSGHIGKSTTFAKNK